MKIFFLFFLFLFIFSQYSLAQDKKVFSFYFNVNESIPTTASLSAFDTLKNALSENDITIFEINSYSSKDGSKDINQHIAEERLQSVVSKFNSDFKIGAKNVYGINYPKILPYPVEQYEKWRRVDVIYSLSNKIKITEIEEIKNVIPKDTTKNYSIQELISEVVTEDVYDKKLEPGMTFQMELKIQFLDGTATLTNGSYEELDKLAAYLIENKNVHAFIRGHVCCGKAMKLSKQRAKLVLKELVKRGVNKKHLKSQGYSNNLPMVMPEKTEADRKKNRRVDIIFSVK